MITLGFQPGESGAIPLWVTMNAYLKLEFGGLLIPVEVMQLELDASGNPYMCEVLDKTSRIIDERTGLVMKYRWLPVQHVYSEVCQDLYRPICEDPLLAYIHTI